MLLKLDGNGERETENQERGTGNREQETENDCIAVTGLRIQNGGQRKRKGSKTWKRELFGEI